MNDFGSQIINYNGLENNLKRRWQVQLHLYEVPFYYIEYGFAQLGAIVTKSRCNPTEFIKINGTSVSYKGY